MFLWTGTRFGSCYHGTPPDLTLSPSAFPGHQMLHLQSRASGGTDPGVSCRIAASFYLEKVGLTGELLTELLNFLFGKAG